MAALAHTETLKVYSSTKLLATNLQHVIKETFHHIFCSVHAIKQQRQFCIICPMLIANSLDQTRRSKVDPEQVGKQTI